MAQRGNCRGGLGPPAARAFAEIHAHANEGQELVDTLLECWMGHESAIDSLASASCRPSKTPVTDRRYKIRGGAAYRPGARPTLALPQACQVTGSWGRRTWFPRWVTEARQMAGCDRLAPAIGEDYRRLGFFPSAAEPSARSPSCQPFRAPKARRKLPGRQNPGGGAASGAQRVAGGDSGSSARLRQ